MSRHIGLICALMLYGPPALQAQGKLPPVVEEGLRFLRDQGAEAAVVPWTRTWSTSADSGKRVQLQVGIGNLVAYAGRLNSWDIVKIIEVTPHLERIYLVLVFERQPIYAMFVAYKPGNEWIVTGVNFHTESDKVFPPSILDPEKPS